MGGRGSILHFFPSFVLCGFLFLEQNYWQEHRLQEEI